jgi:predicted SprT family Zn-dependent metalloprotease
MKLEEAKEMALGLMKQHGLKDWKFRFDRAKKRYGCCFYYKKLISLSSILTPLREERHVKNTILHEIAHVLAGPAAGHGPEWKKVAISIGCNGERCSNDVTFEGGTWVGECPAGHKSYAHRKPKRRKSCAKCYPKKFNPDYLITYRLNT